MQDLLQRIEAKIKDLHSANVARATRGETHVSNHDVIELLRDAREAIQEIGEINTSGAIDVDGTFYTKHGIRNQMAVLEELKEVAVEFAGHTLPARFNSGMALSAIRSALREAKKNRAGEYVDGTPVLIVDGEHVTPQGFRNVKQHVRDLQEMLEEVKGVIRDAGREPVPGFGTVDVVRDYIRWRDRVVIGTVSKAGVRLAVDDTAADALELLAKCYKHSTSNGVVEGLHEKLRRIADVCSLKGATRKADAEAMVEHLASLLQQERDDLAFIHDLTGAPKDMRPTLAVAAVVKERDTFQQENEDFRSKLSRTLQHARSAVLAVTSKYPGGSRISECVDKLKKLAERPALFFENLTVDGEPVTVADVIAMRQEMGKLRSKLHNAKATKGRLSRALEKQRRESDFIIKELRGRSMPHLPEFRAERDRLIQHVVADWKQDLATWIDSTSRLLSAQGKEVSRRLDAAMRRAGL